MSTVAQRSFRSSDQLAFAQLSGDYNPMHMDAVVARRLLFGAPVVHGVHALLWCLDVLAPFDESSDWELLQVKAVFSKPVPVGKTVLLEPVLVPDKGDGCHRIKAKLIVNGVAVNTVSAVFRKNATSVEIWPPPLPSFPENMLSQSMAKENLSDHAGALPLQLEPVAAKILFPRLANHLRATQLASLLAATQVVGVHCPGLNSVFSELNLSRTEQDNNDNAIVYQVTRFDERFNLVTMKVATPGLTGKLHAFLRPDVHRQAPYASFVDKVPEQKFAQCQALVIGGSRGLGEVAVKLLCAGGANVRLTYHQGEQDAKNLVADIAEGGGMAEAYPYNACGGELPEAMFSDDWAPSHVLYFATPPILAGSPGVFSTEMFDRFCEYYVLGFNRIFQQLQALGTSCFFLPSSIYVDEQPTDMSEYVAAKLAAEDAAKVLEKMHRGVVIEQPRLPRMATDQTVSIAENEDPDPTPVLLQALQRFTR